MATVRELVRVAVRAAEGKKASDVRAIDIRGLSGVTDYMVIASGSSDTNVRAIAEGVREKLLEKGERPFSVEGLQEGSWVLLDYVDFVVHVFHYEKRLYFGLEQLWADAKPVPIAATAPRKSAAKPAVRVAAKQVHQPAPLAVLKPAGKKRAVPKKSAGKKSAAATPAGTRKKAGTAQRPTASRKTAGAAVPKPKKTAVPKRKD